MHYWLLKPKSAGAHYLQSVSVASFDSLNESDYLICIQWVSHYQACRDDSDSGSPLLTSAGDPGALTSTWALAGLVSFEAWHCGVHHPHPGQQLHGVDSRDNGGTVNYKCTHETHGDSKTFRHDAIKWHRKILLDFDILDYLSPSRLWPSAEVSRLYAKIVFTYSHRKLLHGDIYWLLHLFSSCHSNKNSQRIKAHSYI